MVYSIIMKISVILTTYTFINISKPSKLVVISSLDENVIPLHTVGFYFITGANSFLLCIIFRHKQCDNQQFTIKVIRVILKET